MSDIQQSGGGFQFLAVQIGERNYCIDVRRVRELRGWTKVSELPHSPEHVLGVIDLRGLVIPIVDLSARLGFGRAEATSRTVIVVIECEDQVIGVMVDSVSEIFSFQESNLQPAPPISGNSETHYVRGVIALDSRMLALLDLDCLLAADRKLAA